MNTADIDQLIAEKGKLCISIVVPTQRNAKERFQNPKLVYKAVEKAKQLLHNSAWPKKSIHQAETKLEDVRQKIDYLRLQDGLAVFISPDISKLFLLPFPVQEKVMLGNNFEIRDLFYYAQFLQPYFLLAVSKKRIPLYKCQGRDLQEIRNDDFPMRYFDDYEYAHPAIASSTSGGLKSYEQDKSIIRETRQIAFLKEVDEAVAKYLKNDIPLLIAGVEEPLANFENVTSHLNHVVGKIRGDYANDALHALAEAAWSKMNEHIRRTQQNALSLLKERIGQNLAVDGIRDVWKSAKEGKGLTLIVEKDYQVRAYYDPANDCKLYMSSPLNKHEIIMDAADDVIEIVREKGGNIVIVENGELARYDRIAMLLRYK